MESAVPGAALHAPVSKLQLRNNQPIHSAPAVELSRICRMSSYRLREAAQLLGVSDDSLRRWADTGRLVTTVDGAGRRVVDGPELARFAEDNASPVPAAGRIVRESARNRFVGLVTRVLRDTVMAQVEMQCGPYRVVSLMSREAADELGLEPGVTAVASVKSTNVVVEVPEGAS
jgi:molybdopterin-binding protein